MKKANTTTIRATQYKGLPSFFVFLFMSLPLLACVVFHFGNLQQLSQVLSSHLSTTSTPRLTYFAARGIVEPIRLILKDADVTYIENNMNSSVFPDLKASGILDYGSLPFWEEDGLQLVQSFAIARYLARKYGYNGNNEIEESKIDSIAEGCKDFTTAIRKVMSAPAEEKVQVWNSIVTVDIPKWLGYFERLLQKSGTGYFVGNKISYADFYVVAITEEVRGSNLGLDKFPLLSTHLSSVLSRPKLASYTTDPTRFPLQFARFIPK